MKIIDYGYLIPSLVVFIGIPLLMIIKLSQHTTNPLDITIYGSTIQTALLAYYIDKRVQRIYGQQGKKYVNVTIISPFDPPGQREVRQIEKTLLTFCGVQGHLLNVLTELDMQFEINEYGIYFAQLAQQQNSKLTPQSQLQIYKLQAEYPIQSLFEYGLSHITAKNIFRSFQHHLLQRSRQTSNQENIFYKTKQLQQLSMSSSIKNLFPYQFEQSGIKYLSETIGLDQQYIHDYIMPVIWGAYLHQPNSITTMLKLLPLYCTQNKALGTSLAILVNENQLYQKLIQSITHLNLKHIYNHHLQQFKLLHNINDNSIVNSNSHSSSQHYEIQATYLNTFVNQTKQQDQLLINEQKQDTLDYHSIKTNLLFIIEDYQMVNKKQISYYKTIIDGKIKGDEQYQEYFTLYFTYDKKQSSQSQQAGKNSKYIYSATRLCKDNCKNFNKNVYLLISKQKLTQKDLGMFQQHHIIYYKKYWLPKTQLPSTKKFQEISNVYRVYDTEAISDSFQFKLHVLDQLSQVVVGKIQQY